MPLLDNAKDTSVVNSTLNDVGRDQINNTNLYYDTINNYRVSESPTLKPLLKAASLGALFDSSERQPAAVCSKGTREDVLSRLSIWRISPGHPICWLHGPAGSGKSAVSQTFAIASATENVLLASFFFGKKLERSQAKWLFPTLALQIASRIPEVKDVLAKALSDDISILGSGKMLLSQFNDLIVSPIVKSGWKPDGGKQFVVVIDALDECLEKDLAIEVVRLLGEAVHSGKLPFKIFITSRSETDIRLRFKQPPASVVTLELRLTDYEASNDIRRYVEDALGALREKHFLYTKHSTEPWLLPGDIDLLVEKSSGLFIFASTVIRILNSSDQSPCVLIKKMFGGQNSLRENPSEYAELDSLYKDVLSPLSPFTRSVVAIVVLLFSPLTADDLNILARDDSGIPTNALQRLNAVLYIPEVESEHIRLYHLSFRDFLTSQERSGDLFVDPPACHARIASLCLKLMMSSLKRDICELKDPTKLNKEIEGLSSLCQRFIGGPPIYACVYWPLHITESAYSVALANELEAFLKKGLLNWFEVLSLLSRLDDVALALRDVSRWVKEQHKPSALLTEILNDAERFLLTFSVPIGLSALHVYHSALPFTPSDTLIRKLYESELTGMPTVTLGLERSWNVRLCTVEHGDPSPIELIAFSPDGSCVASASWWETLIWKSSSGALISKLDTKATALAYSPDGTYLVAGLFDGSMKVWETKTIRILKHVAKHDNQVNQVLFSPDSSLLVTLSSGSSHEAMVLLWDVKTFQVCCVSEGVKSAVKVVQFSPDGALLATGSEEGEIRTWRCPSGRLRSVLTGHSDTVSTIAFSSDGRYMVSAGRDSSVRLWDVHTGAPLGSHRHHHGRVDKVSFSKDNKSVMSFSTNDFDNTILSWDFIAKAKPLRIWASRRYYGKTNPRSMWSTLRTLACRCFPALSSGFDSFVEHYPYFDSSPGDPYIMVSILNAIFMFPGSQSYDGPPAFLATGFVSAFATSEDDTYLASGSHNGVVSLWDKTKWIGENEYDSDIGSLLTQVLTVSPNGSSFVTYTPPGLVLRSCRESKAIVLRGKVGAGWTIFSPDSLVIIHCDGEGLSPKIYVWDSQNGELIRTIDFPRRSEAYSFSFDENLASISYDGKILVVADQEGTAWVWKIRSGELLHKLRLPNEKISATAFSPRDAMIAIGTQSGGVVLWDAGSGTIVKQFAPYPSENSDVSITNIVFSEDGEKMAVGDNENKLWWSLISEHLDHKRLIQSESMAGFKSLSFSADGSTLTTEYWFGCRQEWDISSTSGGSVETRLVELQLAGNLPHPNSARSSWREREGWFFREDKRVCWVPAFHRNGVFYAAEDRIILPGYEERVTVVDFESCQQTN